MFPDVPFGVSPLLSDERQAQIFPAVIAVSVRAMADPYLASTP
jgi:hypothetical protein